MGVICCYSAGVMVLAQGASAGIRYRSPEPVLSPVLPQEHLGTTANVVFPTGIDRRDDLGAPDRFDVYYGMADDRIGVARLDLPAVLPPGGVADPPEQRCLPRSVRSGGGFVACCKRGAEERQDLMIRRRQTQVRQRGSDETETLVS